MFQNICRICAKAVKANYAINIFDNQNKKFLIQIKHLTGIMLKDNSSLPKFMCCVCRKKLKDAYTFRQDLLEIQESFRIKNSDRKNRQTEEELIEPIEFAKVFLVAGNEENDINFVGPEDSTLKVNFAKESKKQVEFMTNDKNAVDLTQEVTEEVKSTAHDTFKYFREGGNFNAEEYNPKTEILTNKNAKRKINQSKRKNTNQIGTKAFVCDQCGYNFSYRRQLQAHLNRHTGIKRFACQFCPKKFFTPSELKRHIRSHTGEKPFACKYCDKRFRDYGHRLKHERVHTNERPFVCPSCGKTFNRAYTLKNHMLTHTGEKKFKCDTCNRVYARRCYLLAHYQTNLHKQATEKKNNVNPYI